LCTPDVDPAYAFRAARAGSVAARRAEDGLPARVIGTVESIGAARKGLLQAGSVARWQGDEGPRWRVRISPGAVKLERKNYAGWNRSQEAGRATLWDMLDDDPRVNRHNERVTLAPERAKRSTIDVWSDESRRRMSYVLKTLDYSPLFADHDVPALVTLTMPRNWEQIAPTPKTFKRLVELLRKRYEKAWGSPMQGVWKIEFQRRGAPHVHLLMTPPRGRRPGLGETFSAWLALAWAQVCTAPGLDWDDVEQRRARVDHEFFGTSIDYSKGLQDGGVDTVAAYFSKHGLFGAKDYQNDPPPLWREAVKQSGGIRFWGYWALKKAEGVVDLNPITPHYVK
jgi:hypothetical protein